MKKLCFFLLLAAIPMIANCQENEYLLDTVFYYLWDTNEDSWLYYRYSTYSHDSSGNVTQIKNCTWQYEDVWREYLREYTWDSLDQQTEDISSYWDADSNDWIKQTRNAFAYDTAGNMTTQVYCGWNTETYEWDTGFYYLFVFDSAGNEIEFYNHTWLEDSNNWFVDSYSLRTYDSAGNRTEMYSWYWDFSKNDWENLNHYEYFYDDRGNMTDYYRETWETDRYEYVFRYVYEYDVQGNMKKYRYYTWNEEASDWVCTYYYVYTYDSEGNQLGYFGYRWDSGINDWFNYWRYHYSYKSLEGKHLLASPPALDFGNWETGSSTEDDKVLLWNSGTEDVTISLVEGPDSIFDLSAVPDPMTVLQPADTIFFNVKFSPNDTLAYADSIVITSDDDTRPLLSVPLSGKGIIVMPADSGEMYATASLGTEGELLGIDLTGGTETSIGATGTGPVHGLTIDTAGMIYGISGLEGDIYRLDAATGTAVFETGTGLTELEALEFGPGNALYGVSQGKLYLIDLNTGFSQPKDIPGYDLHGLAYDPSGGMLWSVSSTDDLLMIDPVSLAVTISGEPVNFDKHFDYAFDIAGNLYAAELGSGSISRILLIDKNTGESSYAGKTAYRSIFGLAFYNVPKTGKHLRVLPESLDFGIVEAGSISDTMNISISNIGSEDVTINDISEPDSIFSFLVSPVTPLVLSPGDQQAYDMVFSPNSGRQYTDTVKILSDITGSQETCIPLSGSGIEFFPADSGMLYVLTQYEYPDSNRLVSVDPSSGEATDIGHAGMVYYTAMAINSGGQIYAASNYGRINRVDAGTGYTWFQVETDLDYIYSMAFDTNDVLYLLEYSSLYTLDLASGVTTYVGYSGYMSGLSFNPLDNTLWGITSYGYVYIIDPLTGNNTFVGYTGLSGDHMGLAFDFAGNLFTMSHDYAATGDYYELVQINTLTGEGTPLGKTEISSFACMALFSVPRPGMHFSILPDSIGFGLVETGESSDAYNISILNSGTQTVSVDSISFPDGSVGFSENITFPVQVETAQSADIGIVYEPLEVGVLSGTVNIYLNNNDTACSVKVSGEAYEIDPTARRALHLEEAGDFMEVMNSPELATESFTIEFWLKVHRTGLESEASGEQNILDMRGGGAGYNFRLAGTEFPVSGHAILLPYEELASVSTDPVFEQNTWYHVVMKRDKDIRKIRIMVNGEAVATGNEAYYTYSTYSPLRIGEYLGYNNPSWSLGLHGEIDDLRIWDHFRSRAQILEFMDKELTGTEAGLSAYWNFNNRIGNVIPDITPNGNDGILYQDAMLVDSDVPKDMFVHTAEVNGQEKIRIYPNPFSIETTFRFPIERGDNYRLALKDMTGRTVRIIENIRNGEVLLKRGGLPAGVYLYELKGPATHRGKIVIR